MIYSKLDLGWQRWHTLDIIIMSLVQFFYRSFCFILNWSKFVAYNLVTHFTRFLQTPPFFLIPKKHDVIKRRPLNFEANVSLFSVQNKRDCICHNKTKDWKVVLDVYYIPKTQFNYIFEKQFVNTLQRRYNALFVDTCSRNI